MGLHMDFKLLHRRDWTTAMGDRSWTVTRIGGTALVSKDRGYFQRGDPIVRLHD